MKIDFSSILRDLKGEPLKNGGEVFTLGSAACTALLTPYPDDDKLDPKEKLRRYKLASKASDGGVHDLSVEDIAELKKLIGKFPPLIVGRCFELLDPES